jgi:hypothetical protein
MVLGSFYPDRFPSFWEKFNASVLEGKIIAVREVLRELDIIANKTHLREWIERNKRIFLKPDSEEMMFVNEIFAVPHFQYLVTQKQRLKGTPVADPFVIAAAKVKQGCVVTKEAKKQNAARIPNVCEYFAIDCTNLEGFMEREHWSF